MLSCVGYQQKTSGCKTTCKRALSIDGGPIWFMIFTFRMWHNFRPGGVTRGKWRIPDGKGESGLFSYSEL
jgi:hypothetical protein